jgi:hypothetical protein
MPVAFWNYLLRIRILGFLYGKIVNFFKTKPTESGTKLRMLFKVVSEPVLWIRKYFFFDLDPNLGGQLITGTYSTGRIRMLPGHFCGQ